MKTNSSVDSSRTSAIIDYLSIQLSRDPMQVSLVDYRLARGDAILCNEIDRKDLIISYLDEQFMEPSYPTMSEEDRKYLLSTLVIESVSNRAKFLVLCKPFMGHSELIPCGWYDIVGGRLSFFISGEGLLDFVSHLCWVNPLSKYQIRLIADLSFRGGLSKTAFDIVRRHIWLHHPFIMRTSYEIVNDMDAREHFASVSVWRTG
jgi:hypothetical protein